MSGMDRLTELLPCPFCGDPMRIVLGNLQHTKNARDSRHDSICPIRACSWTSGSIAAWNRRASQAAPAPSDGLREALGTLLVQANGVEPRDAMLRQNVVRIARAALSTPTEERQ